MFDAVYKNYQKFFKFLPYFFVFLASLSVSRDPDLGWHLKYGEYFVKYHQVLRDNIYSTMMPNFHWANGSWGSDVLLYLIFSHGGFLALTIVGALVVALTFFFFSRSAKLSLVQELFMFPIISYLVNPLNNSSFRGQQISLLFLGILFFILSRYKNLSKVLYFVPVLFLVWCNVHEESFLGLALFGLWTGLSCFKVFQTEGRTIWKKEIKFLLLVFILSFLVTFINPFGYGIHLTAISHFNDPLLKKINEYVPFSFLSLNWLSQIVITILVLIATVLLSVKKKIVDVLPILGIVLVLLFTPFFVRRYAWPLYYVLILLVPYLFLYLGKRTKFILENFAVGLFLVGFAYALYVKTPVLFSKETWNSYCKNQEVPCSPKAAEFIKNHYANKKLFSYYDWGGWLIWNYPNVKPNIDGRMHVWRDEKGYSATEEYDKYYSADKSIDTSVYNVVLVPLDQSPFYYDIDTLMQENKWKLVYSDGYAGVVVRNDK